MKKIRVGLIGCNYMGRMHAECYRKLDCVELAAVADLQESAARAVAEGTDARIFCDGIEMIENCELDAVDICLPTFLHAHFALAAMKSGKNVFIEKPVCLTEEECRQLLACQETYGVQVQVGHVIRFWDEYVYLKKITDEKTYGELVNLTLRRVSPSPAWGKNAWQKNPALSGGALLDLHVHDIDYMLYLLGEPSATVSVKNTRGEKDSYVQTLCRYPDFPVSVEATWGLPTSYPFEMYYRAVFENATVELKEGKLTVYEEGGSFTPIYEKSSLASDYKGGNIAELGGYFSELQYFFGCIRDKRPIQNATLSDGVRAVRFVLENLKD